jgi:hypothetical protein
MSWMVNMDRSQLYSLCLVSVAYGNEGAWEVLRKELVFSPQEMLELASTAAYNESDMVDPDSCNTCTNFVECMTKHCALVKCSSLSRRDGKDSDMRNSAIVEELERLSQALRCDPENQCAECIWAEPAIVRIQLVAWNSGQGLLAFQIVAGRYDCEKYSITDTLYREVLKLQTKNPWIYQFSLKAIKECRCGWFDTEDDECLLSLAVQHERNNDYTHHVTNGRLACAVRCIADGVADSSLNPRANALSLVHQGANKVNADIACLLMVELQSEHHDADLSKCVAACLRSFAPSHAQYVRMLFKFHPLTVLDVCEEMCISQNTKITLVRKSLENGNYIANHMAGDMRRLIQKLNHPIFASLRRILQSRINEQIRIDTP